MDIGILLCIPDPLPDTALFIDIFQSNVRADLIHSNVQLKRIKYRQLILLLLLVIAKSDYASTNTFTALQKLNIEKMFNCGICTTCRVMI